MIRLAGAGDDEIQIEFTGRRPGEKLHEELFTDAELLHATRYEEIVVAREEADPDLHVMDDIDALIEAAEERDWARLGRCLDVLLPGFEADQAVGARSLEATSEERW